jgi:hypothetical protein
VFICLQIEWTCGPVYKVYEVSTAVQIKRPDKYTEPDVQSTLTRNVTLWLLTFHKFGLVRECVYLYAKVPGMKLTYEIKIFLNHFKDPDRNEMSRAFSQQTNQLS